MKRSPSAVSNLLVAYGAFLVVCGIIGYRLTHQESSSSIVNGIVSGILMMVLGAIYRSGRPWTLPAALSATAIFTFTFIWRGTVKWITVIGGHGSQIPIAALLTIMFIISVFMALMLLRIARR
ncbi:MAG: hypothetical protein HYX66_05950 [Ignavibacteria bacterium]|nr:hypothetical protein [Ignavibacteria bacterium]